MSKDDSPSGEKTMALNEVDRLDAGALVVAEEDSSKTATLQMLLRVVYGAVVR
jgi:hypothetical protein